VEAGCAHSAKGDRVAFQSCLGTESRWQDISGTYSFRLRVPPRPGKRARVAVRVLDAGSSAGAPRVHTSVHGRDVDVTVTVNAPAQRLVVAKRVLAGWTGAAAPVHLRVRFVRLLVRRDMDPGCPNGRAMCGSKQTTHGEQISKPPGEWNVYMDTGGVWTVWGTGLLRARDGQVFGRGPTVNLYVPRSRPWRLFVFTRECDWGRLGNADGAQHAMSPCPRPQEVGTFDGDDVPGMIVNRFASPAASLGYHRGRPSRVGTTCPQVNRLGCYELDYTVTRVRRR
jgi:hypothetical protein